MFTRRVMIFSIIAVIVLFCYGLFKVMTMDANVKPQRRDVVFQSSFETSEERKAWSRADWAQWVKVPGRGYSLRVEVPKEKAFKKHMIRLPIDLTKYANTRLRFECMAKAVMVSKPPHTYNGVKYMSHIISDKYGSLMTNMNKVHGTFDWKKLSFTASVPADVNNSWLVLGLQESSGTVMFDDIRITVNAIKPIRPEPDPNGPPTFKGHDLPRLRGVMSPNSFREEDLRVLGEEWNANLIRWQMSTGWLKTYKREKDYNLAKYDEWLSAELNDLDKVLAACKKYGILAVVDLHSPPGGRMPNKDLVLTHEPKYLAKFVSVWQKIARRYKGHSAVWGYDLVNEPIQRADPPPGQPDYLEAQVIAAKAIREIDPDVPIIIETKYFDGARGFKYLEPVDIPNIIYQVHMYYPGHFTHQGINGNSVGVTYPGIRLMRMKRYDKQSLRKHLQPVRNFQLAYNVHIYVGEFSAIRWAPGNSAYRYLKDCIDIFEEYGWDWSYHAFREWDGWSVEHSNDQKDHLPTSEPTERKKLLLKWFAKNQKPKY